MLTNCNRSQVIRLLIDASFLAIPEGSQSALFKSFNSIPTDTMVDKQSPVTQAVFATSFKYVKIKAINYRNV